MEAEACHSAQRLADQRSFILRTGGARSIFNQNQTVLGCNCQERVHLCRQTDLMDYEDGFCARRDYLFKPVGVEIVSRQIDVGKDWSCSDVGDGVSCGD